MELPKRCVAPTLALLCLAAAGCATTRPVPPELAAARQTYARASDGPAKNDAPAELHLAGMALGRAEQSYADDRDAQQTKDLAYIAARESEIAEQTATLLENERQKAQAEADLVSVLQANEKKSQGELAQTQKELAVDKKLLAVQERELTTEQRARADADRRARYALPAPRATFAAKEEPRGRVITLSGSVLFVSGQAVLLPTARDRLIDVAQALKDEPGRTVLVEGHTDAMGTARTNRALSLRRANAVRQYLVAHGVAANRVRAVGVGSDRPVADDKSPEGRADNRRVEIVLEPAVARLQRGSS